MNDNQIIKKYISYKFLYSKISCFKHIFNDDEIIFIMNRFNDSLSFNESLYRILNNINVRPTCKVCGNKLNFIGFSKGFTTFCSKKCVSVVCNPWNRPEVQEKCRNTIIRNNGGLGSASKIIKNKMEETLYNKYGYKHNWQDPEEQKRSHSESAKHKMRQTCLARYGCEYSMQNKEVLRKRRNSQLQWTDKFKKEINLKRYNTKLNNKSFGNNSKEELHAFNLIKEIYTDAIHQYYDSKRYPFMCDIYIPSKDLFIECNFFPTHGNHPFDPKNEEDLKYVEWLKQSKFLHYDYKTFTIRDPKKREYAKTHNLNYIEFWNLKEVKEYLLKCII